MGWHEGSYSYGDLLGMIEFYDAENLVFYDGASYADHCQLKLIKTVAAPAIKTAMTAPNYVEESTKVQPYYRGICLFLCWQINTLSAAVPNNPDFVALSDTIGILEGARNSVLPAGSDPFYQPYQIDASIEFNWSTEIAAYTGAAPYGYYTKTQPYAPFYLTEYKFNGTSLGLSSDRTESAELYDQQGRNGQHLPAVYHAKQRESAVLAALPTVYGKCTGRNPKFLGHHQEQQRHRQAVGHGQPHHSKRHGPGGNLCQRTARAHHSYL